MSYLKPARTYSDQLAILVSRGLVVGDRAFAEHCLVHHNYYRLSAYRFPLTVAGDPDQFVPGTTFEALWALYDFDRQLRAVMLEASERVEISVRSRWAYVLGHKYGAQAYETPSVFSGMENLRKNLQQLDAELSRSRETFIRHFESKYDILRPPIWAACEVMSFGLVSKFVSAIRRSGDRQRIADAYQLDETVLVSFLHHLNVVRNACAHHSRLWNRHFAVTFHPPKAKPAFLVPSFEQTPSGGLAPKTAYNTLVMLAHMMDTIEDYAAFFLGYGLVVVDECHHVPAVTFEALLKACASPRILGLTATPVRKDGLERLLHLQCGPIRHTIAVINDDAAPRVVYVRRSSFHLPETPGESEPIHAVWDALVADTGRTKQIVGDIRACLDEGRCPLVLSDRKAHLDKLEAELRKQTTPADTVAIFRLESGVGKKKRKAIRDEIDRCYEQAEKFVLFATAALIGEGYDLPRLDTLFLTMPLSFKGRLIQYAGRLHRSHAEKREVRVYDYLDQGNPLTATMFRRRSGAYRQMDYRVVMDQESVAAPLNFE